MSSYAEAAGHVFDGSLADALAALALQVGPARPCARTFYDTFDWRLYRARAALIHDGERLRWLPAGGPPIARRGGMGRTAADLPDALRAPVGDLSGLRALLPRLRLEGTEQPFRQGTVRGAIGSLRAVDPLTGAAADLGVRLWLTGPAQAIEALQRRWALPRRRSLLKQGLRALGQRPGDYSRRIKVSLDPDAPTAEAGQAALATVFEGFERTLPGVLGDLDAACLKDLRVAVRRTRAALGTLRSAWAKAEVEPLLAGLKWLGAVTTPVRDLDVYLERLPDYRAALPAALQPALDPLAGLLRVLRAPSQAALVRALTSPGFDALQASWRALLEAPAPTGRAALRPIGEVARRRTAKLHQAFRAEGRAITAASPAEALHALRKTGKKLRYMLEFFRSVHPPALIKPAIKHMRRLQGHLGRFNDLSIQANTLGAHAQRLQACGAPAGTGEAVAALRRWLADLEQAERTAFTAQWAAFDDPAVEAAFEALLAPQGQPAPPEAADQMILTLP